MGAPSTAQVVLLVIQAAGIQQDYPMELQEGELGTGTPRHGCSALRRWADVAEMGMRLADPASWEHLLPQAQGASAGASAPQRCLGTAVLFQGLFLEPSEDALTVVVEEGGRDM